MTSWLFAWIATGLRPRDDDVDRMPLTLRYPSMLTQLLFPNACIRCTILLPNEHDLLCSPCNAALPLPAPRIISTSRGNITVYRALPYEDPYVGMLRTKNYRRSSGSVSLGMLAAQRLENVIWNFDRLTPIPLHWSRLWWRTFNQAELIAEALMRRTGVPLAHLLSRTRATVQQPHLSGTAARMQNVRGAFTPRTIEPEITSVLLVDDIATTGATLSAAVHALRCYPWLRIACITAC